MRALDLGCGGGLYTFELERRGALPVGLDFQMDALRQARKQAGRRKIFWVRGDATRLPFREGIFELVVSVEVLTHLSPDQRQNSLCEIHRATVLDGTVLVTLHNQKRLTFSRWLRLSRAREVYRTINLDVWPTAPPEADERAMQCGLQPCRSAIYLNFHSRFTHRFYCKHAKLSALIIYIEETVRRLPILRCLGITFLQTLKKVDCEKG